LSALLSGLLFKAVFGLCGALIITKLVSDPQENSFNGISAEDRALLQTSTIVYVVVCVATKIVEDHERALTIIINRGQFTNVGAFLLVFTLPWSIAVLVHDIQLTMRWYALVGATLATFVYLVVPIFLWTQAVRTS
jgi:hypothetical protein